MDKICPLMSRPKTVTITYADTARSTTELKKVKCFKEKCAWWYEPPDWKKKEGITGHCIIHELPPKNFNI